MSRILEDGRIVELVYIPKERRTLLAVASGENVTYVPTLLIGEGETLVPVRAENNLLRHRAVLLPECAEEYGSVAELLNDISTYIDRYVDLSESFRDIAVVYVILSWVYDAFNELPYLRFRGDFGSGKTRALQVIGSIMYKPFFASGASTVSPIFHTLDSFRGSLVFDETDFRYSDERSEIVKIFNNGNMRGMPVLRTMLNQQHEFDPRAFLVYGPKLVSMRHRFADDALESRFLTEEMGVRKLRADIPLNLPKAQDAEATALRNKLLMYRFRSHHEIQMNHVEIDPTLSSRTNQMLIPLLALVDDDKLRDAIRGAARTLDGRVKSERADQPEVLLLGALVSSITKGETEEFVSIQRLTALMVERYSKEFERPFTHRYVGSLVRTRLRLPTYKRNGNYVIALTQPVRQQLNELCGRFGVESLGV